MPKTNKKSLKKLRILVSISDKEGIVSFINNLKKLYSLEIIATFGTAKYLKEAGIEVIVVEKVTGFPQLFDGRIKMIHLPIFAPILADQQNKKHLKQLKKLKVEPYDMVVVNLYPFSENVKKKLTLKEMIENIDIGGPAAVRAAAKNFQSIIAVCDPKDYLKVLKLLKKQGDLNFTQRKNLAKKVFKMTFNHDRDIIKYLSIVKGASW